MRPVYDAVMPYVVFGLMQLLAVMLWPGLVTWLPSVLLSRPA